MKPFSKNYIVIDPNMGMVEAAHSVLMHFMIDVLREKMAQFEKNETNL